MSKAASDVTVDVAVCQYRFAGVETVEELCNRAMTLFDRAGPADCFVLPELFAYDLTIDSSGEDQHLTGDAKARFHSFLTETASARDALVVGGSYRTPDGDGLVNRSAIGLPDGTLETYDKSRPIPMERNGGTKPGVSGGPVIEHRGTSVGVLICYDVEFPTVVRDVVDRGAEVLLLPSLTASKAGFQRVKRCAAARAVENQCYVVHSPLVGDHPSGEKTGTGRGSVFMPCDEIVGDTGTGLTLPRDHHTAGIQTLDIGALRRSRTEAGVQPFSDWQRFGNS